MSGCKRCGREHLTIKQTPACSGHISGKARPERAGEPCTQFPMRGQSVCAKHGGKAAQNLAAAAERLQRAEVVKLAATLGDLDDGDGPVDPGSIIVEQIRWRHVHVRWLRARVQALDPSALAWGRTKEKIGGDDYGITREARPNIWLQMYLEAQRDLEKLCLEAVRVGLEERRVRLEEAHTDAYVAMLDELVVALGHDPNDKATAAIVERHLRLVNE